MKLVTINTHSLIEEHYQEKLEQFVQFICKETPDLIAMQEVNQSVNAPVWKQSHSGFSPAPSCRIPIREDNHALQTALRLQEAHLHYYWTWLPIKLGYDRYDEGLAILSKTPLKKIDAFSISHFQDYHNWKTRKILGVQTADSNDWFYSVHMGWWNDSEDPFPAQWKRLKKHVKTEQNGSNHWLMGDFNSPAEVRNEGYDLVKQSDYFDTYLLAQTKDSGITVEGVIDGWRDRLENPHTLKGMRIDQIWCKHPVPIRSSAVIFNGQNEPVISDHFGIMIETM